MSRPRPARSGRPGGFTLVELLVVIGIIALLISILLPSLSSARRQANTVKCLASLRQVGNAFQLYAVDYKGKYPVAVHEKNSTKFPLPAFVPPDGLRWPDTLAFYITKQKMTDVQSIANIRDSSVLWGCPEWSRDKSAAYGNLYAQNVRPGYGMCYYGPQWFKDGAAGLPIVPTGVNGQYYYLTGTRGSFPDITDVKRSSEQLLVADSITHIIALTGDDYANNAAGNKFNPAKTWQPFSFQQTPPSAGDYFIDATRHAPPGTKKSQFKVKGTNVLFWDGHCSTLSIPEAWSAITGRPAF